MKNSCIFDKNNEDMKTLAQLIEVKKLNKTSLAKELFPNVSFPAMAIDRVLNGQRELTVSEYRKLSEITGVPLGFLASDDWNITPKACGSIGFAKGEILAKLDTLKWVTVLYKAQDHVYIPILKITTENMPLKVYLSDLDRLVMSHSDVIEVI